MNSLGAMVVFTALYGPMLVLLAASIYVPYTVPLRINTGTALARAVRRILSVTLIMVVVVTVVTVLGQWGITQLFVDAVPLRELTLWDLSLIHI